MTQKRKAVILDAHAQNPGDLNWDYLEEVFDLTVYPRTPKELVIPRAKDAEVIILNKVAITEEVLRELPKLRFIATLATGYNQLDCEALKKRGIPVSNIPSYSTDGVAQMVFAFLLTFTNHVGEYTESVRAGDWTNCADFCYQKTPLNEIRGKTLGIVGFGQIGRAVAKIADSFGMRVLAFTPSGAKNDAGNVHFTTREEVLREADYVTLHCPLTKDTDKMVNAEFIGQMKDGAALINTARGAVADEQAVAAALRAGKLSYYGADVLSTEPPKADNPLLGAPNCYLTPHIAWAATETRARLLEILNGNVKAYLDGTPRNVVNPA